MPDPKPPQPPEKETMALEKVPAWAIALSEKMAAGFATTNANIAVVSSALDVVRDRVVIIEKWKTESEERQSKTSGRVKATTDDNLKQDAAIGLIKADVSEVKIDVALVKNGLAEVKTNQENAAKERSETAAAAVRIEAALTSFFTKHPALSGALVAAATSAAVAITNALQHAGH